MLTEIFQFLTHHFILSSLLILTLILLIWEESRGKTGGFRISLQDATTLINHKHAVLIDVRDTDAFNNGHMVNALSFPQAEIMNKLDKLKKYQDKPIILIDNAGHHAVAIAHKLIKQGFNKTFCLTGGLQTWLKAGLPLTKTNKK